MRAPGLRVREDRLRNGMRVLAVERRSHPVVAVMLWYEVGSRDEGSGETGTAHFLEHMMFKGTRRLAKGEIDWITARLGGSNNAFTDYDATAYYFHFARDRWETALAIEAERMRGGVLDPAEFEREKKVVLEEMRMGDDDPWRELGELVGSTVYLEHPYHHPIIGWRADVEHLTREGMRAFYKRHYVPERAVLVVAGDVKSEDVFAAARKHFRAIPRIGAPPRGRGSAEAPQRGERRVRIERDAGAKRLLVAYRGVKVGEERDYVLDVLAAILATGRSSRLHRRLVKELGLATFVAAENEARGEPGLFSISAEAREGVDEARLEAALDAELDRLACAPVRPWELARAKRLLEVSQAFSMESAAEVAERAGRMAVLATPRYLATYAARIRAVKSVDIQRVAREVLDRRNRTVGWSVPMEKRTASRATRPGAAAAGRRIVVEPARPSRRFRFPVPPRRGAPPVVERRFHREVLGNGVVVLAAANAAAPTVSLACYVDLPIGCEPAGKSGIENLTGSCLEEGSRRFDGDAIARIVEDLGGTLDSGSRGVSASGPADGLTTFLEVAADCLRAPAFPRDAVERVRGEIESELAADEDDLRARALRRLRRAVYGRHPLRLAAEGTAATVKRLTHGDVVAFHARWYAPARTIVAVSGDVDPQTVVQRVRRAFGGWRIKGQEAPPLPPVPAPKPKRIFERASREQTHFALGHAGVRRSDPDFYALLVLDHVLGTGPGFTDRLSRRIRDELGLVYSIHGNVTGTAGLEPGMFVCHWSTEPSRAAFSERAVRQVLKDLHRDPPTEEEVRTAKDYLIGSYPFGLERNSHLTSAMLRIERFGLGLDYFERFPALVEAVTVSDVARVARAHLHPEALVSVAVGPQASAVR